MHPRYISREASYEPYVALWNARLPEMAKTPETIRAEAEHTPETGFEENVLFERDAHPVALVLVFDPIANGPAEYVEGDVLCLADVEAELAPTFVDLALESARRSGAKRLGMWTTSRHKAISAAFLDRGFEIGQIAPVSRLDLDRPTPERLRQKADAAMAQGLRLATAADLDAEGFDWIEPLYHATWEMRQDMPTAEPHVLMPFDQYAQNLARTEIYRRELMFMLMDGDRIVGYTRVVPSGARSDTALTGFTGVARSHRRMGLASALKVHSANLMRDMGYRYVVTDNDDRNPMYALNLELGFEPIFEFLRHNAVLSD